MAPLTRDNVHQSLDAFMDMFLADQEKPNRLNNGNGGSIRSTTPKNGNDDEDADVPAMEAISDNIFGCFPGAGHRQVVPVATTNNNTRELMESTKSTSTKSLKKKKSNVDNNKEEQQEQEEEEEMTGKEKVNDILARKGVQLSSSSSSSDENNDDDDMNNSMARSFVNSMFGGNGGGGNPFGMGILAAISEHTEDPSEANGGGGDDRSTRSDWLSLKSSKSRRNSFNENGANANGSAHSTIVETFLQSEIASTFSNLSEMLIKFRRSQSVSSSKASSVTTADVRSMKSNTTTKTSKKQKTIHEEDESEDSRSDNTERDSSTEDNDDEQRESASTSTSVTKDVKPEDIVKTASALSHLLVKHQDPVVLAPTGGGGAIRMNRSRSSASFVSGVGRSRGMSMDTSDNMSLSQFGSPTSVVTGTGSMIDPKLSTDSSYVYTPPIRLNSKLLLGGGGGGGASVTSASNNNKRRSKKSKKNGMSLSREFSIEQQDSNNMMASPVPSVSVME